MVIDCFTKYMYCEPLKTKSADNTLNAFKKIFKRLPETPKYVFSDLGTGEQSLITFIN